MKQFLKKRIRSYLINHLGSSHPKNYYFLRWLSDIVEDKDSANDICATLGSWIVNTDIGSSLINYLNDLFVVGNGVYIVTYRPGLWIGKGGRTVDSLEHCLNYDIEDKKINDYEVRFIEIHKKNYSSVMGYINFYSNNW